jgi:Mg2+-importing ATPase
MNVSAYASQNKAQLFDTFHVDEKGLFHNEVIKLQDKYGYNELKGENRYWWHILLNQFTSPFLYLLIASAILSILLGERIDGLMIFLFVGINALLGFYQEFRSEQTLKFLKKYVQSQTKVIRSGKEEVIPSNEIVPGDIILLEAGDIVPADIRLLSGQNVTIDESVLTGESVPVQKSEEKLSSNPKSQYDAENICFSGTTLVSGVAKGIVLTTGKNTAIGEITKLTVETHRESSFEKGISRFSKFILYLILFTLIGVFIINIFIKGQAVDIPKLLIFSIALAVSVIPEALPIVITFSLSRGALQLAKHKVVVKRLSAIEDLGSIDVLCTDKTGTLTENQLSLHTTYKIHDNIIGYAALATTLEKEKNKSIHSFDLSLLDNLQNSDKDLFHSYRRIQENPFDPERKRNSMVIEKDGNYELIVRGAVEEIIKLCSDLSKEEIEHIHEWLQKEAGNRVIAVGKRMIEYHEDKETVADERDLQFIGMISFSDPIKKTVPEAVHKARSLGIQIKVLTGDSPQVAGAVAYQIGLIDDPSHVVTGDELEKLDVHKQLKKVRENAVFARVSPEQKYKIIQLLQEKYEVGFLGEGINDAPALKIANVAIVVQGATDIAREASDIILLNKSLKVIIDGIKEGRETFANTSKYIKATLSSNFGNFYTVAIASLFINFLPLLPLQILLINLLTDFPMIAVAADTVDSEELISPRTYDIREIALVGTFLGIISSFFDFLFFALFVSISPQVLQTNWFMGSVLTELVFLFSIRTRLPIWKAKKPAFILFILTVIAFMTAILLPYTSLGHRQRGSES